MNAFADFVYRVAITPGRRRTVFAILGAVVWYGGVALAIVFSPVIDRWLGIGLTIPPAVRFPVGIALMVVGAPAVLWTIARFLRVRGTPIPFNPPPQLVTGGLYGVIRNPMLTGWTLLLIGVGILLQSCVFLAVFMPAFLLLHIFYLKLVEEKELERKFGQAYADYRKRVPMFIPGLKGKRPPA